MYNKILLLIVLIVLCCITTDVNAAGKKHMDWAKTPPMGWNSWDCFGCSVTEDEVKANADYMAKHLKQYGWQYIIVDIQWYEPKSNINSRDPYSYPRKLDTNIDEFGRVRPAANKHPSSVDTKSLKPLADYVHSLGLKFGIHMMRGIPKMAYERNTPIKGTKYTAQDIADTSSTCPWNPDMYGVDMDKPGAQEYYNSIFNLIATWGVDYVKIDDLSRPYHQPEVTAIRNAIDQCGRPIVFSTSPGATPLSAGPHVSQHANLWRISDDFWDQWQLLKDQFERLDNWSKWCDDGHYPDADMLPLGNIRSRSQDGWTRFTKTEQKTMMTTWAIVRSPLMMGGHMPNNDEYTLSLLTNDEMLYVNQNSTKGRQLFRNDDLVAWVAEDRNSSDLFIALINANSANDYDISRAAWSSPIISKNSAEKVVPFEVSLIDAEKLSLVVDDGGDGFSCDHADWLNAVFIDKDGAKTKLTDLKWENATSGWGNVSIDRSISGNTLSVADVSYENGIGTHSKSVIKYHFPKGKYVKLTGSAGLDDGGSRQRLAGASVQFAIFTVDPESAAISSNVSVRLSDLGIKDKCLVRDLWAKKDLGEFSGTISFDIENHGSMLLKVSK